MKNHYLKDRNIEVNVGPNLFRYWAIYMKFKNELNKDELNKLELYLKCIKRLPDEVGKVVVTKYLKLAKFYPSKSNKIKYAKTTVEKYNIRQADHVKVSETLGITPKEISKLDNKAYKLMAEFLLEEKLTQYTLIQEEVNYRTIINNSDVDQLIEKYKSKYEMVTYKVTKLSGKYSEVSIDYFEEFWVEK